MYNDALLLLAHEYAHTPRRDGMEHSIVLQLQSHCNDFPNVVSDDFKMSSLSDVFSKVVTK